MLHIVMVARRLPALAALLGSLVTAQASVPGALPPGTVPAGPVRLSGLLPASNQTAQVMRSGAKITIVNLQNRVVSLGGSREALQMVMAQVARGEMPSYDPRLGISKEEFTKYLAFQTTLESTGRSMKLAVSRDPARVLFSDVAANGLLRGLSFDLRSGELRVPEGLTFRALSVDPSTAPDRSIDLRGGFQWNLKGYNAETQSGINGQLSLFQLGEGQSLLVYKRLSSLIHGTMNTTTSEIILRYSLGH